jgi:hypothetical protein
MDNLPFGESIVNICYFVGTPRCKSKFARCNYVQVDIFFMVRSLNMDCMDYIPIFLWMIGWSSMHHESITSPKKSVWKAVACCG